MADISSLGIGSGVLTADVIDQLKEADKSRMVKPIENKLELVKQKQESYNLLSSFMNTFKASVSSLSYDTLFDNKTVDVEGEAKVSVDSGANVDSFTLQTITLAKKDITKFGAMGSKTTSIASADGVLKLSVGTKDYNINYDSTTSLQDLAQSITETAGGDIEASILETNDGEFSLVISSKQTGIDQTITIADSDDGTSGSGSLDTALFDTNATNGYKKIQNAEDAEFKYNGITVIRSSNEIDDLILGVDITLKKEGDFSSVNIDQDTAKITDEVQLFVDNYNSLMSNLNDMTAFDEEAGTKGVFQGDNFVNTLKRDLSNGVSLRLDSTSLMNYGIEIDRQGNMSFDKSVLESKLQSDQGGVKEFFSDFFEPFNDNVKQYTKFGGLLSGFNDSLTKDSKNLTDAKLKAQSSLDAKYEIMTKRFISYDAIISKLNSSFSMLQMMIDAEANSKK
jgi:flagellar hook-associated protein 2